MTAYTQNKGKKRKEWLNGEAITLQAKEKKISATQHPQRRKKHRVGATKTLGLPPSLWRGRKNRMGLCWRGGRIYALRESFSRFCTFDSSAVGTHPRWWRETTKEERAHTCDRTMNRFHRSGRREKGKKNTNYQGSNSRVMGHRLFCCRFCSFFFLLETAVVRGKFLCHFASMV